MLNGLNDGQLKAVQTMEGPVMVIAGPGTGKTQVIAARIGNILLHTDTQPQNILCLTYTEAATIAMRNRLIKFIGPTAYNIQIFTFHAFCNIVIQDNLRYFGGIRELQVINDLEEIEVFESMIDALPNDHILKRLTGDIYYERSRLKELFQIMKKENWTSEYVVYRTEQHIKEMAFDERYQYKRAYKDKKAGDLKPDYQKDVEKFEELIAAARLFDEYNLRLKDMKRYDFHDMILWVLKAFASNEDLLRDYQERFHYFLVDEYQDTNGAQNDLLYQLCDFWESPNVFVVGDDDQSIYRFQGANMENILEFKRRFSDSLTSIVLTDNYRSTQSILDASRQLIVQGEDRLEAKLPELSKVLTGRAFEAKGDAPQVLCYFNTEHEKADLIKTLISAFEKGERLSDYAVIYRQHSDVENVVRALEQKGVPLNLRKKLDVLQEPWIAQLLDVCRYVSMEADAPFSGEYLLPRIMHYKYFEIHPFDIAKLAFHCGYDPEVGTSKRWREVLNDDKALTQLSFKDKNAIIKFRDNLNHWVKDSFNETVQVAIEKILNFGGILGSLLQDHDKAWKMQLLTTFFDFVKEESRRLPFMKLSDLLETVDKMLRYKVGLNLHRTFYNPDGIHFVTSHSSKGLEFKRVFVVNVVSNKWEGKRRRSSTYKLPPNIFSKSEENVLEDERRLFYVAMTRAEQALTLSYAEQKEDGKGLQRSRFLAELEDAGVISTSGEDVVALSDEDMMSYGLAQILNRKAPQLAFIDNDVVDKVLEKFKLSVTALNKYLQCPISFYFENILKVPSARTVHTGFGNVVHSTLEILHNQARKMNLSYPGKDEFIKIFESQMSVFHSHFTQKEYEDRLAYGKQFLPLYYDEYIDEWKSVAEYRMEYSVSQAVCDTVPIKGRLDRVEIKDNVATVVDFKTGKRSNAVKKLKGPSEKDPLGGDYWRQIVYYKILLDNDPMSDWKFGQGAFDFVQPDAKTQKFKVDRFTVSDDEIEIVKGQINSTYQAIINRQFEEGCGEEDCRWCNFVKFNELDLGERDGGELDEMEELNIETAE